MSMDDMRKKYEKDSPAAKSFRKPATRRKLFAYLTLSVVSIGLAIYLFASTGNGMGAMVPLVVGVIALLVVYDTWRQLEK
jgi:hypothetical protein